jgi:PAS domain S-box-containing protein
MGGTDAAAALGVLFAQNPHPMWILDRTTLRFLAVNDAALARYGYARDEFLAMTVRDIRAGDAGPDEGGACGAATWRHRTRDGAVIDVEVSASELEWEGRPAALVLCCDVTERVQGQRLLARSERRLQEAQSVAEVGSWEWDIRSGEVVWSLQLFRIYGVCPDTFVPSYEAYLSLVHPECRERVRREIELAEREGTVLAFECRIVRPDGAVRDVAARAELIRDGPLGPLRMVGTAQDITERRRAEAERARLIKKLKAGRRRLSIVSRRLLQTQEAERAEIARELHDEVGQLLTGLKLMLETPGGRDRSVEMTGIVNDLMARVRGLSMSLRPPMLDDLGLVPALLWLVPHYTTQTGVQVDFRHYGLGGRLPSALETAAFRIVQEALTNVARHAGTAFATVSLDACPGQLRVQVRDEGRGFDLLSCSPGSAGLAGMRERARLVGGRVTIESRPGQGTLVSAVLPLPAPERG